MVSHQKCVASIVYFILLFREPVCGDGFKRARDKTPAPAKYVVDHSDLLDDLLASYNYLNRPVLKYEDTLVISIGIDLRDIRDLTIGVLDMNLWLTLEWVDVNLIWSPEEANGTTELKIPPHRMYKPDIFLYNAHEEVEPTYQTLNVVKYNGVVKSVSPGTFLSSCNIDVTNYPFEEHSCELRFGSWSHHGGKIQLRLDREEYGELLHYEYTNTQWEVKGISAEIREVSYPCCEEPFYIAVFKIRVGLCDAGLIFLRNTCVLVLAAISILFSLTVLPIVSGQRMNLGVLNLLILVYTITSLTNIQLGGQPSTLVFFYKLMSLLVSTSILANGLTYYIYNTDSSAHRSPNWVEYMVCQKFAYWNGITLPKGVGTATRQTAAASSRLQTNEDRTTEMLEALISDMEELVKTTNCNSILNGSNISKWQFLATVLDRLFLILYIVSLVIYFLVYFYHFATL